MIEEVILGVTNVAVEGCIFMSFFKAWNTKHTEPDQGVKGDKGIATLLLEEFGVNT